MVIIDTSVIIDHLRQSSEGDTLLLKIAKAMPKENLALSVISVQELYEGKSTKNKEKEQLLLATISPLKILSYTYEIAQKAGEIARESGQPIELADAAIAATAIVNNAELLTVNKKHFEKIPELKLENNLSG
ncbi:MAG: PIN domain-containing protein [Patescibacteria group bacterium]|nr:PIN domain-containing protein [Patescibacteria group bacterium]